MRFWYVYAIIGAASLLLFAKAAVAVRSGTAKSWRYRSTHNRAADPEAFWSQVAADAGLGAMFLFGLVWNLIKGGISH